MNKRLIGYWTATALFCLAMTAGGTMSLLRVEPQQEAMANLGYTEGPPEGFKEGAYADLLIVEGNPLEDVSVLEDYENNIKFIMKDRTDYKNELH
jgi:hypothetical protein